MKWYEELYVGESIRGKEKKIKWKIEHNVGTVFVYVIAFASNSANLLDLIPARELLQKGYPKKDLHIIGLAKDYEEALHMTTAIVDETYQATGTVDIYHYLMNKRREDK